MPYSLDSIKDLLTNPNPIVQDLAEQIKDLLIQVQIQEHTVGFPKDTSLVDIIRTTLAQHPATIRELYAAIKELNTEATRATAINLESWYSTAAWAEDADDPDGPTGI